MKLSIITINYNNKIGLEKTIVSVLSQIWRDFEWIIIDGGSTDGSKEIIDTLAKNPDSKISYWCSEKDNGVYNAMNKGLEKANGEYLNFMNSGDCYADRDVLNRVFQKEHFKDIIYGDWVQVYTDHTEKRSIPYSELAYSLIHQNVCHQSIFVRRNLMLSHPFSIKYGIIADWGFLVERLFEGCSVEYISLIVAKYDMYGISNRKIDLHNEYAQIKAQIPPVVFLALSELYDIKHDPISQAVCRLNKSKSILSKFTRFFILKLDQFSKTNTKINYEEKY